MVDAPNDEAVLRTLVLTDLVGSTALVEQVGDRQAAGLFAQADRITRDLLAEHGGLEIDHTDGFLMLFERPLPALRFTLELHDALEALSTRTGHRLIARAGVHLGEVFLRPNAAEDVARGAKPVEVEGMAKPRAARLMSLAGGGQTLLTRSAFDISRRAAVGQVALEGLQWQDHGSYLFQGVSKPVEVFEVARRGQTPSAPPDSGKVRRARPSTRPWMLAGLMTVVLALLVVLGVWLNRPAPGPWPVVSDDPVAQQAFVTAAEAFRDADPRALTLARRAVEADSDAVYAWVLLAQVAPPSEMAAALAEALVLVEGRSDRQAVLVRLIEKGHREAIGGVAMDYESTLARDWDVWLDGGAEGQFEDYLSAASYPIHGAEADFHAESLEREHENGIRLRGFVERHPDWPQARLVIANSNLMARDGIDEVLEAGLARCPSCAQLKVALAEWHLQEDEERAHGLLMEALELDAAVFRARELLAHAALERGDEPERARLADAVMAPESPEIVRGNFALEHAANLMVRGRQAEAQTLFQLGVEAYESAGEHDAIPNLLVTRNWMLMVTVADLEGAELALADLERALARVEVSESTRGPTSIHLMSQRMHLALLHGDLVAAEALMERLENLPPDRVPQDELTGALAWGEAEIAAVQGDLSVLDGRAGADVCGSLLNQAVLVQHADVDEARRRVERMVGEDGVCGPGDDPNYAVLGHLMRAELSEDPALRASSVDAIRQLWPHADPKSPAMLRVKALGRARAGLQ